MLSEKSQGQKSTQLYGLFPSYEIQGSTELTYNDRNRKVVAKAWGWVWGGELTGKGHKGPCWSDGNV